MNLEMLAKFITKSGMRKMGTAIYMFTALCILLGMNKPGAELLPSAAFVQLVALLIAAAFAGNAFEHHSAVKKEDKADAPPVAPTA